MKSKNPRGLELDPLALAADARDVLRLDRQLEVQADVARLHQPHPMRTHYDDDDSDDCDDDDGDAVGIVFFNIV